MTHTPHQDQPSPDEHFFEELERRRTSALVQCDLAVIEELHAPDYELVTPGGRVFTRAEYIAAVAREPFYVAWEISLLRVRVVGGMAALRYKAKLGFPSGREVLVWHTDTYEQRAGRWQAVWSQATELGPSAQPP